ncbi:MAG: ATP-binding protein [Elainellaceae cyanobacterium]
MISLPCIEVLLIEDNIDDADLLQELFEEVNQSDYKITVVEQLSSAIEQLRQRHFDVVLADLSLPDAEGLTAVSLLNSVVPDLPVIVLTGFKDEEIALEAVRLGAQDYLEKGKIEAHTIIRSIRYSIERSRMQQVMYQQSVAIDATSEGISILDSNWKYVYVNEAYANIYAYPSPEHLHQKSWKIHYKQQEQERLEKEFDDALKLRNSWLGEAVGIKLNGQDFYQEISLTRLPTGGVVCILRNISDRKKSEEHMQEILRETRELYHLKSNFITTVSHEFRTPLSIISTSTESLKRYAHQWSSDKINIRYEHISNSIKRITNLLDDLLFMNRSVEGQMTFNPIPLSLKRFCQALITTLNTDQHSIQLNVAESDRSLLLDPTLLSPMLTHVLSNAVKYSPHGGRIKFDVLLSEKESIFLIQDEGIGISKADQEKLFIPFFRGSNVDNISGIGMGLTIAKHCVDQCKGGIRVSSQVNQGTLVAITLPVVSVGLAHD